MSIPRNIIDVTIIQYNTNGDILYLNRSGLKDRHLGVCKLFSSAFDGKTSGELRICINDQGLNDTINISDFKECAHNCYPCYIFSYDDYDEKCARMQELATSPYIHDKMLWIGTISSKVREDFMRIQHERILNIDRSTGVFISHEDHTKYRYLIDIEGGDLRLGFTGFSERIPYLLHTGRLLFIVDRPLHDWVLSLLEPWVHYVPVKRDFSDLFEKIEWADTHPVEVGEIIKNALRVAPKRVDAVHQVKKLISSGLKLSAT